MSTGLFVKSAIAAFIGAGAESRIGGAQHTPGDHIGWTALVLTGLGFWSTMHGMVVGKARTKYMEQAKADGEADVEERYMLPNLYAQGTSKNVKAFNCVQRSHQHIFEGLTQLCVASLVAALSFPISTAISTTVYAIGRYQLSNGYAETEGDASKRYSKPLSSMVWYGMLTTSMLSLFSSFKLIKKSL